MCEPGSSRSPRPWQIRSTAPAAVGVPPIAMPLELRLGDVRHEVVLELAGGFEVARAAIGALLGTDVVFDEGGAGRGLGPKAAGVLTMSLAAAVGSRAVGLIAAPAPVLAVLMDGLQLVLDLGQPAVQVGVLHLEVGDPLLQGGDVGRDGGLGLGRDRIPERCGDRRSSSHTPTTKRSYRRFGPGLASGHPKARTRDGVLNSYYRCTGAAGSWRRSARGSTSSPVLPSRTGIGRRRARARRPA